MVGWENQLIVIKRTFYGWMGRRGEFRLSLYPPDAPVRPSGEFESKEEAESFVARKRGKVLWWPLLPDKMMRTRGNMLD
jgi:hypothetical protein